MDSELGVLGRDIEEWRRTRAKPGPMPEELWERTVVLARALGLYTVAQALRVNYGALKERLGVKAVMVGGKKRGRPAGKKSRQSFVEVKSLPMMLGAPKESPVVEVAASDGARLTIRLNGGSCDVAALISAFRGGR
jgi:hypothetical protein